MRSALREFGIQFAAGLAVVIVGSLAAFVSGGLTWVSARMALTISLVLCAAAATSWAAFAQRATAPSTLHPETPRPRYTRWVRLSSWTIAVALILVAVIAVATLSSVTSRPIILVVDLINSTHREVRVDSRADFSLSVGGRTGIGRRVADGQLDLLTSGTGIGDQVSIPASSTIRVVGVVRNSAGFQRILVDGSTDLDLTVYKVGGGFVMSDAPFRFDQSWLDKYALGLQVASGE